MRKELCATLRMVEGICGPHHGVSDERMPGMEKVCSRVHLL